MVWPGTLPPVTKVNTLGPYRLDGELLKLDLDEAQIRTLEVPDELYLRQLGDLDLDDTEAVVDFTNTYGRLGHLHPSPVRGVALAGDEDQPEAPGINRRLIHLLDVRVPDETTLDWGAWHDEVTNHPSMGHRGAVEAGLMISDGLQHIDAFRAWARAFRILTETYSNYMGHQADETDFLNLTLVLTELLQPFSPTIQIGHERDLGEEYDPLENTHPRLENILALQMYRHIAAVDAYKRCENEPCGRLFVHQEGRAEHGQHRSSGVKYCSKNCAKAQAEREGRRRRRQQGNN